MGDPYSEFNEGETALATVCARWTCTACRSSRPMGLDACQFCGGRDAVEHFLHLAPDRP